MLLCCYLPQPRTTMTPIHPLAALYCRPSRPLPPLTNLQAAICHHSCSLAGVQHIQSTTIPPNAAPIRIFQDLGFMHSRTVDRWPQDHLQHGYEAAVGFVPNTQQPYQPVQYPQDHPHMLDHIPGA